MLLKTMLQQLECTVTQGNIDVEISDVIYDSRKVIKDCIFVCLKGSAVDSHKFAQDAAQKGAAVIVASDTVTVPQNVTLVMVKDTRAALAVLSAAYFGNPAQSITTVGLTGTKGKTTTVSIIKSVLEAGGIKTGTIGTLGIIIGDNVDKTMNTTPESYEIQRALRKMVDAGCGAAVIEASSLGLKWHRTDGFMFDYGVFTNFSDDHIGGDEHKDMEEYLYCKSLLFKQCKIGIINTDDSNAVGVIKGHTCKIETFGFDKGCDLYAVDEGLVSRNGFLGVRFTSVGIKNLSLEVPIPGHFSVYNALAAVAVCSHFNVSDSAIVEGLKKSTVKGRVEPVAVTNGDYTLLIDYAHNAMSMENVLTTLRAYNPHRLITLFGAGGNRPKVRRYEMGETSGNLSDLSVITADNSRFEDVMDIIEDIKTGIHKTKGKYVVIPDRKEAIRYCIENAQDGDIIVLAGKGHEDYQEIKGVRHHLDEREVIAEVLADISNKTK